MTCPDWPTCKGALVPELAGPVILEWLHRAIALTVGFVIAGTVVFGWRVRKQIAGLGRTLIALLAIFAVQVGVGGWTIKVANSPESVAVHWGMAMTLLTALCALAILAVVAPAPGSGVPAVRPGSPAPALAAAAFAAFVTMCIGSFVSSSHFGLACTTVPGCDGTLWGTNAGQFAQMLHRIAAVTFFAIGSAATWYAAAHGSLRVRRIALTALALVVLQISLGVANVVWQMPMLLREAHAANAVVTFLAYVSAAFFALLDPVRAGVQSNVQAATSGLRGSQRAVLKGER
jgi:cytochrome c oxidase assembly protein subunit 15